LFLNYLLKELFVRAVYLLLKDGAFLSRCIFAKVMTMGKKYILARVIGTQKEKCG